MDIWWPVTLQWNLTSWCPIWWLLYDHWCNGQIPKSNFQLTHRITSLQSWRMSQRVCGSLASLRTEFHVDNKCQEVFQSLFENTCWAWELKHPIFRKFSNFILVFYKNPPVWVFYPWVLIQYPESPQNKLDKRDSHWNSLRQLSHTLSPLCTRNGE